MNEEQRADSTTVGLALFTTVGLALFTARLWDWHYWTGIILEPRQGAHRKESDLRFQLVAG